MVYDDGKTACVNFLNLSFFSPGLPLCEWAFSP